MVEAKVAVFSYEDCRTRSTTFRPQQLPFPPRTLQSSSPPEEPEEALDLDDEPTLSDLVAAARAASFSSGRQLMQMDFQLHVKEREWK